jgi:hypothetical protein
MFSAPFLATLLHRVKAVVRRMVRARAVPVDRAAAVSVSPELRGLAGRWMSARLAALSAAMRRIEAGETLTGGPGGARCEAACALEARLPRGFGWMCAVTPEIREDGAAFAAWLAEPAMRAMVAAAPGEMARLIAPILHAVGERRPDWFPKREKRAVSPREVGRRDAAENRNTARSWCDHAGPGAPRGWSGRATGQVVRLRFFGWTDLCGCDGPDRSFSVVLNFGTILLAGSRAIYSLRYRIEKANKARWYTEITEDHRDHGEEKKRRRGAFEAFSGSLDRR